MKRETIALHHGYQADNQNSVAVPIHQTTSFSFNDAQHAADLFDLKVQGNIYSRIMNPTCDVLEQRISALEGGIGALAVASGMAAITYAIQTLAQTGDNIISISELYGGTYNLFAHTLPRQGIEVRFVDKDNGTTIGGLIVDSGKFPWHAYPQRFPLLNEPDISYHGVNYAQDIGAAAFIARARVVPLRNMGAALSAQAAWNLLQGLETLALRIERINHNTFAVAQWLSQYPQVNWVNYAGLSTHKDHSLAKKYMHGKASGILSFGIVGGREAGARFYDALNLILRLVNIGDAKSCAAIPASTTHRQLNDQELQAAGVSADMVRLSIGIEHIDDLLADLEQALQATV